LFNIQWFFCRTIGVVALSLFLNSIVDYLTFNSPQKEEMEIREYRVDDQAMVIDLWKSCGLVVPWNDPQKDIDRKMAVDADLFLVGVENNTIIGTAMGGYDGHRGWVNYLAVCPSQQRKGIGHRLMKAVEKRIYSKGCPKINIQVRTTNKDVLAFYDSLGYTVDDVVSLGKRLIADD
jgi:ribosomal protein S18 acetylase RimI-like enzyme